MDEEDRLFDRLYMNYSLPMCRNLFGMVPSIHTQKNGRMVLPITTASSCGFKL
ncbi:hypothetical protein [Paenibacillus sp. OAS669]|uniref:hypothetical protein n=1 Tax=Paenibacillus sp. OAS669 TaxID=2663821 RepID=UPI00178A90AB|nr:hypothetical protein [Paenibacillus sp. OAS669]MBE1445270.1 hypothetical protein [Paenibacillus sp. OAS669]